MTHSVQSSAKYLIVNTVSVFIVFYAVIVKIIPNLKALHSS